MDKMRVGMLQVLIATMWVLSCHGAVRGEAGTGAGSTTLNLTLVDTAIGDVPFQLTFSPVVAERIVEQTVRRVYVNYTYPGVDVQLRVQSQNPEIARIVGSGELLLTDNARNVNASGVYFDIEGVFLGRTWLTFDGRLANASRDVLTSHKQRPSDVYDVDDEEQADGTKSRFEEWERLSVSYMVSVIRPKRIVDTIFMGVIFLLVINANIGMGCKIDLQVVKEVLRKPFAPVIGFCSQFIFMPLLAYGIAKLIGLQGGQALGFFAMGCAPGGGASNMYTYILGGDVSLSVTMTLISTMASLAMIPFWFYTLGQTLLHKEANIQIPFLNIIGTLALILVPVGIGIAIQLKLPKVSKIIQKILKPLFIVIILIVFTFGVWANLYVFKLFTPKLILAGCLLPYCGFLLGGVLAFLCRQKLPRIIAICIETGIQNTGVPILMLRFSLPMPEGDLSIIAPIVTSTFTPLPLWIAIAINETRKKFCARKKEEVETQECKDMTDGELADMETTTMLKEGEINSNKYET